MQGKMLSRKENADLVAQMIRRNAMSARENHQKGLDQWKQCRSRQTPGRLQLRALWPKTSKKFLRQIYNPRKDAELQRTSREETQAINSQHRISNWKLWEDEESGHVHAWYPTRRKLVTDFIKNYAGDVRKAREKLSKVQTVGDKIWQRPYATTGIHRMHNPQEHFLVVDTCDQLVVENFTISNASGKLSDLEAARSVMRGADYLNKLDAFLTTISRQSEQCVQNAMLNNIKLRNRLRNKANYHRYYNKSRAGGRSACPPPGLARGKASPLRHFTTVTYESEAGTSSGDHDESSSDMVELSEASLDKSEWTLRRVSESSWDGELIETWIDNNAVQTHPGGIGGEPQQPKSGGWLRLN
ncbi:hypothetical protein F4779DRAFT_525224 [Xylariaceae sp. FL0662B]|nr:hypothetical protein F4779DRAFT_525224 [Xylariaceae sp. FL0662B]